MIVKTVIAFVCIFAFYIAAGFLIGRRASQLFDASAAVATTVGILSSIVVTVGLLLALGLGLCGVDPEN